MSGLDLQGLIDLIADRSGLPAEKVTPQALIVGDLHLDSIVIAEVLMETTPVRDGVAPDGLADVDWEAVRVQDLLGHVILDGRREA
jgi:hypothetical protein